MLLLRSKSTAARGPVRVAAAALCLACAGLALPAWALRPVHVYEVDVDGQTPAALQDAMRQMLVRATGRREAAQDPALAALIADAPKYVKSYATGPRGESQVVFDGAAVESAISAAGRSVWQRERPFTLVVLDPPRPRAAQDAARAELERVAAERGLPISLIPLAVVDGAGNPLSSDALLGVAQRYGADEILVGRGGEAAVDAPLQWSLYTQSQSATWSGALAAGIEHTVDLLVPQQASSLAQVEGPARVRIEGVGTLSAYAAVARLLQSVPGVRRANIAAAEGDSVTFDVEVRGGAAGIEQALSGTAHLARAAGSGSQLVYRYQPQG
jgi:uncharacterized protein